MPRRYLTLEEATATLQRGKVVEYFFGLLRVQGVSLARYLSIVHSAGLYVGSRFDHVDTGHERFADIYSFPPFPVDLEEGVPNEVRQSHDLVTLLEEFNADPNRLLNAGMIQDEYLDLKRQESQRRGHGA
jgi:hypothetical protein